MRIFESAGLYVVTSAEMSAGRTTLEVIRCCLDAGVKLIQLREKNLALPQYRKLAEDALAMTREVDALLIINDHLDVALEVGADGCHLGQGDEAMTIARERAPDLILGASTHNEVEIREAENAGASYINIGPIYPTGTKDWQGEWIGLDGLRNLAPVAAIPFTVMGGIKMDHVADLTAAGARTLAVVTAVTAMPDPAAAARELMDEILASRKG